MNLTIVVDDATVKRARIRAIQENMSVNAVVREYLTARAGAGRHRSGRSLAEVAHTRPTAGRAGWIHPYTELPAGSECNLHR